MVAARTLRSTVLLGGALACLFGALQLVAAVATVTFVLVTGVEGLLGVAPALVLGGGALASLPAGRMMDRVGRIPVLVGGFALGAAGAATVALSAATRSALAAILGFAAIGAATGIVNLARAAAGDLYPPERRGRGIALVIFGGVFGAMLGPTVFMPLFGGRELEAGALAAPWLVAAGIMIVGGVVVAQVRPDPRRVAEQMARSSGAPPPGEPAPLAVVVRRPGVPAALLAALASFAVMVAVMNLTGYVLIGHGHHLHQTFPVVAAHMAGMFGLVLVVGDLIDRVGRPPALVGGLALVAVSCLSLAWVESVWATAVALFVLGLGWNFSFVAATAQLADLSAPAERGRLLGFSDLLSQFAGAALCLIGGFTFSEAGVVALALGATGLAVVPAAWLLVRPVRGVQSRR